MNFILERDFAVRFSDEVYASKEEVKKSLSISSVDSIWERILTYRNYFKRGLDLISIEHKNLSVCLTAPLQERIVSLEKRMIKNMVAISRLDGERTENLTRAALMKIGESYASENSLTVGEDTLMSLIEESSSEIPQAYLSLKNYLSTLRFYMHRSVNRYDLGVLTSFYGKILRKEIDSEDFDSFARMIDHNNPADHVLFGRHYNAAPLDRIEPLLNDLFAFNRSAGLFSTVKAIVTYFYLIYIKPFDYFNEECALLSLKYIIANDDIDGIPFMLNLEKRLLNINEEVFNQKFLLSEMSLDVTYFMNFVLEIIEESLSELEEMISADEIISIRKEFSQFDEPKAPRSSTSWKNESLFPPSAPVVFEQKVSMPTLPTGLDEKDIDLIADNLLELYPSLKVNQARFYAAHCTIGKYYSIAQYKKETGVAYETARTSMDNLVHLGFYKKEQIKNKYVYTPVVR